LLLPDTHGLVLCANVRDRSASPIIICTASKRPEDLLFGFKLGADDVVSKPVPIEELVARIEVALRRPARDSVRPAPGEIVQVIGPLAIDRARYRVTLEGDPIHLTPTEYRLLCILAERPNHVLSPKELAERVWESPDAGIRHSLETHIRRLRAKLKSGPAGAPTLTTLRGFGYELTWEPGRQ
jgi:DNA-binding response OmpR family regulator